MDELPVNMQGPARCFSTNLAGPGWLREAATNTVRRSLALELCLTNLLQVGVHGLHEAEARLFDCLNLLILLIIRLAVPLLQAFHECLKVGLDLLHLRLLSLDELVAGRAAHLRELFDLGFLLIVAELQVRGRALGPQAIRECLQSREIPATFVILEVVGVAILDGRVSAHTYLIAQLLARGCAINICDQGGIGTLISINQLVPIGFHALAMSSPRCLELHENRLAGDCLPRCLSETAARNCRQRGRRNGETGDRAHGKQCLAQLGVAVLEA
mmetsp:Transcript_92517/g.283259  ORF Transcript_92517/g.283259 Transcript_92517/m.283259 type:complete len:272 (+) Transcript_92517:8-823(+)